VASAAADGFARMADRPAATLLHLGPGLGNAFANLHNARRGSTPVVNIVGDHATYHKQFDAPLESDIDAVAGACSRWVHRSMSPDSVAADTAQAVAEAQASPGGVATLILPADVCWLDAPGAVAPVAAVPAAAPTQAQVDRLVELLRAQGRTVLLIGGRTVRERGLVAAERIRAATDAVLLCETFPARQERGAGVPDITRLAYLAEFAEMQIGDADRLIAVDTPAPVSFFAYPGKASVLTPESCEIESVDRNVDPVALLEAVADALGASEECAVAAPARPELPSGALTSETVAQAIGALLPENAVVVDEANTSGLFIPGATAGAPRHDWLCLTGGAIGVGLPLATGAAIACPDRPVLCLQADGSAMYTIQALWTQVREQLNVTTVIFSNRSYAILNLELSRVGAEAGGPKSRAMLDLTDPIMDFVSIASGMGVQAARAETAEEFNEALRAALAHQGPSLVEAVIPALGL
jgi:acetolactate synthase-1/2/3 large subunit